MKNKLILIGLGVMTTSLVCGDDTQNITAIVENRMTRLNETMNTKLEKLNAQNKELKAYRYGLHAKLTEVFSILATLNQNTPLYDTIQTTRTNITQFVMDLDTSSEQEGTQQILMPAQQFLRENVENLTSKKVLNSALNIIMNLLKITTALNEIPNKIQKIQQENLEAKASIISDETGRRTQELLQHLENSTQNQ